MGLAELGSAENECAGQRLCQEAGIRTVRLEPGVTAWGAAWEAGEGWRKGEIFKAFTAPRTVFN